MRMVGSKFMFMKILHKPTLKADVVYDQLSRYLKRRFKVSIPPRTKERDTMHDIHHCECARDRLQHTRGSPCG